MPVNYLKQSLLLLLLVSLSLSLLSLLPEYSFAGFKLKKIDLLADVHPNPPPKKVAKKKKPVIKKPVEEEVELKTQECKPGITCIEDFSPGKKSARYLFQALANARTNPVRVAFYGDSFIEGDILCASFRDTLQQLYGGRGVGYVPITSEVAQFRTTITHTYSHWETYSIVGRKNAKIPPGMAGFSFRPLEGNEVEYKPGKRVTKGFKRVRLFYQSTTSPTLSYILNDTSVYNTELPAVDSISQFLVPERNYKSVKFSFNNYDSLKLYGASFEDSTGIYVDNFSMRGNSGMGLSQIPTKHLTQFNRYQNYKLILIQYGLNVVGENDSTDYDWYVDKMVKVVNRLKESFPECGIIIISVSDRSSNQNGKFATIPAIPVMRDAQREIAQRCQVGFWDLYSAMGGQNSMLKYVAATPPMAAKDYTHLTYWGGKKIAKKLADALLTERDRYYAKKKNLQ